MSDELALDARRILEILPHRPPFVLVDGVARVVPNVEIDGHHLVSSSAPWVPAHFPGRPVMPGVLVVEALAQLAGLLAHASSPFDARSSVMYLLAIDKAKFRRPVVPGERLDLHVVAMHRRSDVGKFRGEARVEGALAAEAELLVSIVPRTP